MLRNSPFWWIVIGVMVVSDIYFFQALRAVTGGFSVRTRTIVHTGYWIISVGAILFLILLPYLHFDKQHKLVRTTVFATVAGLFFAKLIASVFFLADDLRRGVQWVASRLFSSAYAAQKSSPEGTDRISRSVFLSWTGMIMGGGLFGTLVYGFGNKYRYQVRRVKLQFPNLPAAFRGLRIAHISDIHSGSFNDREAVMKGVYKLMKEQPDLVLFTGDLVNNVASEMDDYIDVFSQLQAPMGIFSTLGNHDYGDYVHWHNMQEKIANLQRLKDVHRELGWRLLMNEHVVLERRGDKIALLGIENWSAKARFPKYGDMKKAYAGTEAYPFKILMSHDPSHWKAEVVSGFPDVDLTLSGPTHGMQFGVEIPGLRWSPVQYVYKEWAGLYFTDRQKLYVNRGFGFIGYPGRVGILPEITILELS